jgi:hypothetical protein
MGQGFKYVSLFHVFEAAGQTSGGKIKLIVPSILLSLRAKKGSELLSTRNKADCNEYF